MKHHLAIVGIVLGLLGGISSTLVWMEHRFSGIEDRITKAELKLLVAIDRHEEWVSKEHQNNTHHVNSLLVGLARNIGAIEKD